MIQKLKNITKNNNFLSLFGNMVFAILSIVSLMSLARSFDKDLFGQWVMYITAIGFIDMVRQGITSTALVKFLSAAQNEKETKEIVASGSLIQICVSVALALLIIFAHLAFKTPIDESGYKLFFQWYPAFAILAIPFNNSLSILQAKQKFGSIISLRLVSMGSFVLFIILNYLFFRFDVKYMVFAHIGSNFLASLYSMLRKWSGVIDVFHATRSKVKELLNFGKYSLGTLVGSHLLKSSDTFILGIMMTNSDAAIYAIPMRVIDVFEIPLRSFLAVAMPRISNESRRGNNDEVRNIFYRYTGMLMFLFIPLLIGTYFFAGELITILGGDEYTGLQTPINVLRIFLIYSAILLFDRFSGVTLDCINKPNLNMIKVIVMVLANIIGDIVAIMVFNSLEAVATVTVINSIIGVSMSYHYMRRELKINLGKIPQKGLQLIKNNEFMNLIKK